jgi:hypothetical protein
VDEIPEASRPLITRLFQLWFVLGATLIFNMVACIVNFAVGAKDSGSDLGSSIGCAPRYLSHSLSIILTPSKLLHLHHPALLLALVQVSPSPLYVNFPR